LRQKTIQVCVDYELEGKRLTTFPAEINVLERCRPIYEAFPGWMTSTSGVRAWDALPQGARDYLVALERLTGKKIWLISLALEKPMRLLPLDRSTHTPLFMSPWKSRTMS